MFIPILEGDKAGRAEGAARRLGDAGHARDAEQLHLGAGRLALRLPRRLHAQPRRQAGHAGQGPHADQRRQSGATTRRSTRSRSSPTAPATRGGSTSTRTATFRRGVRDSALLAHRFRAARYFRQAGSHFNPYTYDDIKTIAEHRHYVGATPHGGNNRSDSVGGGHAHSGLDLLPGRHLAEGVPRQAVHGQPPRPPHQRGRGDAEGQRLRGRPPAGLPAGQRPHGRHRRHADRPGRQPVLRRLVGQAGVPPQRGRNLGPHQRPHLQGQPREHEAGEGAGPAKVQRRGTGAVPTARERVVRAARPADFAGAINRVE